MSNKTIYEERAEKAEAQLAERDAEIAQLREDAARKETK